MRDALQTVDGVVACLQRGCSSSDDSIRKALAKIARVYSCGNFEGLQNSRVVSGLDGVRVNLAYLMRQE